MTICLSSSTLEFTTFVNSNVKLVRMRIMKYVPSGFRPEVERGQRVLEKELTGLNLGKNVVVTL